MDPNIPTLLYVLIGTALASVILIAVLALLPDTPKFREMLVGVVTDPALVGLFRALLAYTLPIAVAGILAYLGNLRDPRLLGAVPILIGIVRVVEGKLDQIAKPQSNAIDPPKIAGSGGGNPAG